MIELKNITKSFNNNVVFSHLSISFPRGKMIGIFGKKDSGKRTLINIIAGNLKVDSGDIFLYEKRISHYGYKKRRLLGIKTLEPLNNSFVVKWITKRTLMQYLLNSCPKNLTEKDKKNLIYHLCKVFRIPHSYLNYCGTNGFSGTSYRRILLVSSILSMPEYIVIDAPYPFSSPDDQLYIHHILHGLSKEYNITFILSDDIWVLRPEDFDIAYNLNQGELITINDTFYNDKTHVNDQYGSNFIDLLANFKLSMFDLIKHNEFDEVFVLLEKNKMHLKKSQILIIASIESQYRHIVKEKLYNTISVVDENLLLNQLRKNLVEIIDTIR